MKIDVEKLPGSQVEMTVEVEPEMVEKYVQRAYRSLVNRINVPGFRKGKAPRYIVERMVGKDALLQDGVELLLPDVFKQAIQESDIQPIDRPEWEVVQQEPLTVKGRMPVRPTVELGSYADIRLAKEQPEVTDEQVDSVIERMREQQTQWMPVERPAAMGDRVTVDIQANLRGEPLLEGLGGGALVQGEGEQLLNTKETDYLLRPQTDVPIPGLAEQIVGLGPGEEKQFEIALPESFPEEKHAGKMAGFKVKVHAIREKQAPELDDEFAKTVGDYSSLAELRQEVRKELQARANAEAEIRFADAVVQMAVDRSTVEIPKVMVEREAERSVERMIEQLQRQGISADQYLKAVQRTREQMIEEAQPAAEKRIKAALVIDKIGDEEKLEVSPEEIDEEIEKTVATMGDQAEKARLALNNDEYRKELAYSLREKKVVKFLSDLATSPDGNPAAEEAGEDSSSERPNAEDLNATAGRE